MRFVLSFLAALALLPYALGGLVLSGVLVLIALDRLAVL